MFIFSRFEELRAERGITKTFIADQLGRNSTIFQDWKNKKSTPNDMQLKTVARLLGTTPEYLTGESNEKYADPVRAAAIQEIVDEIMSLPPADIQKVAEYVAFLKSRGGK